jgi:hypothetical protein
MHDHDVLQQKPGVASAEIGDEVVFLHEDEGYYFSLDSVGAFIWRTIARPHTVAEIVAAVTGEYEVAEDRVREDLAHLVPELLRLDLIVYKTAS